MKSALCQKPQSFKDLISEAKQRMKRGYWNDFKTSGAKNEETMTREEAFFFPKIKKLAEDGDVIHNPIGLMMDRKYFDTLTPVEKQEYVFKLSRIYLSIRAKLAHAN